MTLYDHLRAMAASLPPGASVILARDWLAEQLEADPVAAVGPDPDEDMTLEEMAAVAKCSPSAMRGYLRAGRVDGARKVEGMGWRAPRSAFNAWYRKRGAQGAVAPAEAAQEAPQPLARPRRRGTSDPVELGAWREIVNDRKAG